MGRLIERIRSTIRKRSIAVELSRTLARRTRGRYVEESYVRIDHVRTWSRDRVALVFRIRQPCRKMKRIIASPRLCTLLDISVHRPLDSDILMPKGFTRRSRLCTVDTSDYICTRIGVYIRTAFEYAHRICTTNHSAYISLSSSKTSLLTLRMICPRNWIKRSRIDLARLLGHRWY